MFSKFRGTDPLLDSEIERTLKFLNEQKINSEEYNDALEILTKLESVKDKQKSTQLSKDTIAIVSANILGILLIIRHEHVNVITSRAMNMVLRSK